MLMEAEAGHMIMMSYCPIVSLSTTHPPWNGESLCTFQVPNLKLWFHP